MTQMAMLQTIWITVWRNGRWEVFRKVSPDKHKYHRLFETRDDKVLKRLAALVG